MITELALRVGREGGRLTRVVSAITACHGFDTSNLIWGHIRECGIQVLYSTYSQVYMSEVPLVIR